LAQSPDTRAFEPLAAAWRTVGGPGERSARDLPLLLRQRGLASELLRLSLRSLHV